MTITTVTTRKQAITEQEIGRVENPELADIRIVHGPADFDPMMPPFVTAFLSHALRNGI